MDHFEIEKRFFLIIADDYSGWIDIYHNLTTSSKCVIESLKRFIAIFGLPKNLVSDNGRCFTSEEFESFCVANGIKHITTPPRHPQSNGLAERAVGLAKQNLKKFLMSQQSTGVKLMDQIQNYLFQVHNAPLTDVERAGKTPSDTFKTMTPLFQLTRMR